MTTKDDEHRSNLAKDYAHIVQYLEELECEERVRALPHLIERAPNVEIGDLVASSATTDELQQNSSSSNNNNNNNKPSTVSLRRKGLKTFSLTSLDAVLTTSYENITHLDVSNNELMELPGLANLYQLLELSIERNWFNTLPVDIGKLTKLRKIDASRNFLKPNTASLRFEQLKLLTELNEVNLSFNKKCCTADHRNAIEKDCLRK
jgi:hypothetical protein